MEKVYIKFMGVNFEIRRKENSKGICIGVDSDGSFYVETMPNVKLKEIRDFLSERRDWLYGVRKERQIRHKYENGEKFYFMGKEYRFSRKLSNDEPSLSFESGTFIARGKLGRNGRIDADFMHALFTKWYARRLEEILREIFPAWCKKIGAGPKRVHIKEVTSLWGSCSSKGNMTFNVALALVPRHLLEYVIVHELCHIFEMNHSERFWQLVAQHCPNWKECREELNENAYKYKW